MTCREPLAHSPLRFIAILAMVVTSVGAVIVYLVGSLAHSDSLLGAGLVAFLAAWLVVYGLVLCSPRAVRSGAIAQAAAASVILLLEPGEGSRDQGVAVIVSSIVICLDVAMILWSRTLRAVPVSSA